MYDIWIICYGILTIVFICVGYFAKDKDQSKLGYEYAIMAAALLLITLISNLMNKEL